MFLQVLTNKIIVIIFATNERITKNNKSNFGCRRHHRGRCHKNNNNARRKDCVLLFLSCNFFFSRVCSHQRAVQSTYFWCIIICKLHVYKWKHNNNSNTRDEAKQRRLNLILSLLLWFLYECSRDLAGYKNAGGFFYFGVMQFVHILISCALLYFSYTYKLFHHPHPNINTLQCRLDYKYYEQKNESLKKLMIKYTSRMAQLMYYKRHTKYIIFPCKYTKFMLLVCVCARV